MDDDLAEFLGPLTPFAEEMPTPSLNRTLMGAATVRCPVVA